MSSNPYENEPGFEDQKEPHDKKNAKEYVDKVGTLLQCLRVFLKDWLADSTRITSNFCYPTDRGIFGYFTHGLRSSDYVL
jgi:hypothetical protein